MNKELPISIRAYAKQLNVDEKAVRKAIEEGKVKRGFNKKIKKIIPSKANEEWGNLHQVIKPQRGVSKRKVAEKLEKQQAQKLTEFPANNSEKANKKQKPADDPLENYSYSELIASVLITPNLSYSQTILRKEILALANEKMELEERQGMLVRKVDVEKSLFAIGDSLKKALLNISNRCIDDIMSAPNKVEAANILNIELNYVLNQFAQKLKTV